MSSTATFQTNSLLQAALAYAAEGWPVLPLIGKRPLTEHGVKDATQDATQITQWWSQWPEANIGLATGTKSGRLVLDIDIKNGKQGDESLRILEEKHGPLPKTRKSMTASGGWHFVFRMPDAKVKSRNGVREGIDLLADGKYFVAPPSMINGKAYQWTEMCEAAPCPAWVAELGQSPSVPQDTPSENRIPALVRELFPEGRESNGEWITRCPYHDDHDPSFEVKLEDGVFHCFACDVGGSFIKLYAKMKHVTEDEARRIIRPIPAFVEELNQAHAVMMMGGKCVILNEEQDPIQKWKTISFSSPADLKLKYQNRIVQLGDKAVRLGDAWLNHQDRREYRSLVFAPDQSVPEHYNLWQGFAVTPKPGNCELMLELIRLIICGGHEEHYRYVMAWLAQAVQEPSNRPGTALVFRGKQGTGKGTLCRIFGSLYGPHFIHVARSRHLVGNFNAHLKDALIVFADEAYWAGDKSSEGALKAMITEAWLPIEYKGRDVVRVQNHIRLMMATNQDWPVPAGFEERRFCIIDVSEKRMQDKPYFRAIQEQMKNGGREAFLHYLLHYDHTGVDLNSLPHTEALMETKLLTMNPAEQFWYEILERGTVDEAIPTWTPCIKRKPLHDLYLEFAKNLGLVRRGNQTVLGSTLRKLCPHKKDTRITGDGKPERAWYVGELQQCRDAFDRVLNWPNHDWGTPPGDQNEAVSPPTRALSEVPPAHDISQEIEYLEWDQFGSADTTPREKEATIEEKAPAQPPQAPSTRRILCQPKKRLRGTRTPQRGRERCTLGTSRSHRPKRLSGKPLKSRKIKSTQQSERRRCNLNNLKKGR
ncbi:MAG: bifunctional DNA primase/polymerase [Nitrospirales bacterium]